MTSVLATIAVAALLVQDPVPDAWYYEAIQTGADPLAAEAFAKLESEALARFAAAEAYLPLVKAFAATTERVWAVIYGEVYLNLLPDDAPREGIDTLVFGLYDEAIQKTEKGFNVSLTKQMAVNADDPKLPFALTFELAFTYACLVPTGTEGKATVRPDIEPLTIQALTEIRREQLASWKRQELPTTELVRWQLRVLEAGHFEAYNQWLFRAARPEESKRWLGSHPKENDAWLEWQRENRLKPAGADFQRSAVRS